MSKPPWPWIRKHGFGTAYDRILERVEPGPHGCLLWPGATGGNVPQIRCSVEGVAWVESVTRIIWETEVGPVPDGMQVKRACANERCVNAEHLTLCTPGEMPAAALAKAFANILRGENHPQSKLTQRDVEAIRAAALRGESLAGVADELGVSKAEVYHVAGGYTWAQGGSRRARRQRRQPGEAPGTQHCGHCHEAGHRRTKCPQLGRS